MTLVMAFKRPRKMLPRITANEITMMRIEVDMNIIVEYNRRLIRGVSPPPYLSKMFFTLNTPAARPRNIDRKNETFSPLWAR
jgi:hypothetical protein